MQKNAKKFCGIQKVSVNLQLHLRVCENPDML